MIGVSSLVYGSGGGSGGAKLPSNVLNLSGTIRNDPVNWLAGATCVAVLEMTAANPVSDTQISGGLWATADGLEFRDGTNVAVSEMVWMADDDVVAILEVSADGAMRLGRLS